MTAGSEFAALGARRGLRGVRPEEGKSIFLRVLNEPGTAVNVTIAQGELDYFGLAFAPENAAVARAMDTASVSLSLGTHPFLAQHVVRGRPVVPGTMELELVARAARKLYPELQVLGFDDMEFTRFVALTGDVPSELRITLTELTRGPLGRQLAVEVRGQFKHASGKLLDPDVLHARMKITLANELTSLAPEPAVRETGSLIRDPYACGAEVDHQGVFAHLSEVALGSRTKSAMFRRAVALATPGTERWELPMPLLDACLTLGMITQAADGSYPVCAAHGVRSIRFARPLSDASLVSLGPVVLYGTVPSTANANLLSPWVQARGSADQVLVDVRGMSGSPMGSASRASVERTSLSPRALSAE